MSENDRILDEAKNLSSEQLRKLVENCSSFPLENFRWKICRSSEISDDFRRQIFDLFEENMKTFCKDLNREEKFAEIFDENSREILIFDATDSLVGFVHFRFDLDFDCRVVYLYEIQIRRDEQSRGFGTFFMENLKTIGEKTRMEKIVLTVHKENRRAMDFYRKKHRF